MSLFDNEDEWKAFMHGTIIGLFAGITIGSSVAAYLILF